MALIGYGVHHGFGLHLGYTEDSNMGILGSTMDMTSTYLCSLCTRMGKEIMMMTEKEKT